MQLIPERSRKAKIWKTTKRMSSPTYLAKWECLIRKKSGVKHVKLCEYSQTVLWHSLNSLSSLTAADTKDPERKHCDGCTMIAIKARRRSAATPGSNLPPSSAKIRKILEILDEIKDRSNGEEKTIIFSQFTSMLDLIQPFLQARGVRYTRCAHQFPASGTSDHTHKCLDDGSMRKDQRELSLEKIKENSSVKVILISFKAGSTGKCPL